jgi:hypothetical protein
MRFGWGRDNRRPQPTVVPPAASGDAFDADALTFIAAHEAASGTTMGSRQKAAINELYLGYKGIGTTNGSNLWALYDTSKHIEYPFCPIGDATAGNAHAYGINFVNPAAFSLTWFNFLPADLTIYGVQGDGATKRATTGLNLLNDIGTWDFGSHAYLRTQNTSNQSVMGAQIATGGFDGMLFFPYHSVNFDYSSIGLLVGSTRQATRTGLISIQNAAGTQEKFRNGTSYDIRANTGTLPNLDILLFARQLGATIDTYCSLQVASIHPCTPVFTTTEMEDYHFIWQRYHTNVITGGRNV